MNHARAVASGVVAMAAVTGAVYALRPVAPVLSLGALYLFAVLPMSLLYGLRYAIAVAVASQLVFNFLFLPPLHTFALRDARNWVALAVYLVTAVVVSQLADVLATADRLRRSDEIKTTLLRSVSHDLRSPLTAIRAASEALASPKLSEPERAALADSVRIETRRLDRLVGNLLDLSRLEVGAAVPHRELWTADSLVGRALDWIGVEAERVAVVLPESLPPVFVDAAQIDRALVNLLENALAVTPDAWPVQLVASEERDEVVLRIIDRGPGVPNDQRERIFHPFERGEGGGSGLGLAIARGFAEANESRLWVEPARPRGSAFVLAIPASTPIGAGE
jgi:two-component system sensor histidine kinase KdpD